MNRQHYLIGLGWAVIATLIGCAPSGPQQAAQLEAKQLETKRDIEIARISGWVTVEKARAANAPEGQITVYPAPQPIPTTTTTTINQQGEATEPEVITTEKTDHVAFALQMLGNVALELAKGKQGQVLPKNKGPWPYTPLPTETDIPKMQEMQEMLVP